jgi:biopolymer transport protein ExbB
VFEFLVKSSTMLARLIQDAQPEAGQGGGGIPFLPAGQLIDYFDKGGPMMWLLLIAAVLGLTFVIERFWVLSRSKIRTDEFLTKVRAALLKKRSVKQAISVCEEYRGPIAAIMKAGLLKYGTSDEEIEKNIEIAATHELARLERGLAVLATVANVAPLIGFLGTVTGMINAFDALAKTTQVDPRVVSRGISEALITTASGLLVAVPILVFYNWFSAIISRFVLEMETASNLLLETFIEMESGGGAPAEKPASSSANK